MNWSRRLIYLFFFFSTFCYLALGILFFVYYREPNIPLVNESRVIFARIEPILTKYGVHKLYDFDFSVERDLKSNFLLDFSQADLRYKDSIVRLAKEGKITLLEDRLKKWRKFKIISGNNDIKAQFKLHGSSTYPYVNGFESFTIKSKNPITGLKNFKLITGLEMDFNNVFFNYSAKLFDLIAEDSGEIVVTNSLGKYRDFFQYEVFDEKYLAREYGLENTTIIRRLTFDNGKSNWHASMLDATYYNIDLDEISEEGLTLWQDFLNNPAKRNYDPEYMGRFFALLQLYNFPHQIIGNNDKWVLTGNTLFPVFREESYLLPIMNLSDIENNTIFNNYYFSRSLNVYKKLLLDDDVLRNRNIVFKKIVDSGNAILKSYDSIYSEYSAIHRKFGPNFLRTKLNKKRIFSIIENNLSSINAYLNSGYTVVSYQKNTLKLSSSRKNMLKVSVGNVTKYFFPIRLELSDSGDVREELNELFIDGLENIDDLIIEDVVLKQKLLYEKDYSIIHTY